MNINSKFAVLAVSILGFATINAQAAEGTATATVITPIAITAVNQLDFGKFAGFTGGNVVMTAGGSRSFTGTVVAGVNAGNAASFSVTGDAGSTYAITLPTSATLTGPGTDMVVGTFISSPTVVAGGTLNGSGAQTLSVGATLVVPASQVAGNYSGTFDVTVAYN